MSRYVLVLVFVQLLLFGCSQAVDPLTVEVVNGVSGQENPCVGQDVVFRCTFVSGLNAVEMVVNVGGTEASLTVFVSGRATDTSLLLGQTLTANRTSETSVELLIPASPVDFNESTIRCETEPETTPQSRSLIILGTASGPMYSYNTISQSNFTGLSVPLGRPLYGWECIDSYMVIAESEGGDVIRGTTSVATPEQLSTVVPLTGMNLCRNGYSLTAVAITNGSMNNNFTVQGPYPATSNSLGTVMSDIITTLPLTTTLSWSLSSTPDPPDCVTGYMLSFTENTFTTENTSVSPNELTDNDFPGCKNRDFTISLLIPAIDDVESNSLSLQVRVEEGFQSPQNVTVANSTLQISPESSLVFMLVWTLSTSDDVNVTVGYSFGSQSCIPNITSSSRNSHPFSVTNFEPSELLVVCVRVQVYDCNKNSTASMIVPIAITATSPVKVEPDGIQIVVTRNADFATQTQSLQVSITPNAVEIEQVLSLDTFTVTITGLQAGIVYNFTIQALDGSNTPIGIPITGVYPPPSNTVSTPPPCGLLCIILIVIAVIVIVILFIAVPPGIIYRKKIFKRCYSNGKEETDTHELKSPTDRNSVEHEQAPGGEEYAVVTTTARSQKPAAPDAFYQDPATIKHEQAETGDLYAVADKPKKKSSKKKEKSEDELAGMYSVPDKSKKNQNQLTYADIDIGVGSGKSVSQGPQTEYATVVN